MSSKNQKSGGSESAKSGRKLKNKSGDDSGNVEVSQKSRKETKRAEKTKKGNPSAKEVKANCSTKDKKQSNVLVKVSPMERSDSEEESVTTLAGEKNAELFIDHVCKMSDQVLKREWEQVNMVSQPALTTNSILQQYATDPKVPCFIENRVKLENMKSDFYHCNRLTSEKNERKWIIAQPPKEKMQESFWKMVFQEGTTMILMLGPGYDQGKKQFEEEFFPQMVDQYKYFGTMYVTSRKVETDRMLTIYTLEVLQEGCSKSIVMKLVWAIGWKKSDMAQESTCLAVLSHVHKLHAGATVVSVSASGTGRACVTAACSILGSRICNGANPNVMDFVCNMRQQRARSIPDKAHYMFLYYILAKFAISRMSDKTKWERAEAQLKKINTSG